MKKFGFLKICGRSSKRLVRETRTKAWDLREELWGGWFMRHEPRRRAAFYNAGLNRFICVESYVEEYKLLEFHKALCRYDVNAELSEIFEEDHQQPIEYQPL